jgi:hypothetical protein
LGVNCSRTRLYFDYALIGAAGAGELSSEIDYTYDYADDDYSHAGVHAPTDSEYLLGIAM